MNLLWKHTMFVVGLTKDAHYVNINPKRDFNVEDIIVAPYA